MATKEMMKKKVFSSDHNDDTTHKGVDSTVSLYLSDSSISIVQDDESDDDDEEIGRRTRQQNDNDVHVEQNQQSGFQCTKEQDEKRPPGENEASEENQDKTITEILYKAWTESHWAFQVVATITGCFWTYALVHDGNVDDDDDDDGDVLKWDPQIAIMVVLVLTGVACPINLFAPVGVGVFAGAVPVSVVPTYTALTVLSIVSAVVWRVVAYTKFLLGFGGRMGTTTFIAMNVTAIIFLVPFGHMQNGWNAYGQPNWSSSNSSGDSDVLLFEWDKAVVFVCSTIFLSVVGASFRIRARQAPVHPFLTPCAVALSSDLVVAVAVNHHRLAPAAYAGFSVGSYVAMAALTNLPNKEWDFFLAGLAAGVMGVLLEPFFVDFGGKAGFTAFLGYSTYKFIIMPLVPLLICNKPKQELPLDRRQEGIMTILGRSTFWLLPFVHLS